MLQDGCKSTRIERLTFFRQGTQQLGVPCEKPDFSRLSSYNFCTANLTLNVWTRNLHVNNTYFGVIYIYIYTYLHTHTHAHVHVNMYVHMCMSVYICTCKYAGSRCLKIQGMRGAIWNHICWGKGTIYIITGTPKDQDFA